MTEPPEQQSATPARGRIVVAILALLIVAGAVGALLWSRDRSPEPTRATLDLAAPVLDIDGSNPILHLRLDGARPGDRAATIEVVPDPASASFDQPTTVSLTAAPLTGEGESVTTQAAPAGTTWVTTVDFTGDSRWWQLAVTLGWDGRNPVTVPFWIVIPDPNLYGADEVPVPDSDPVAEAVYQRGVAATRDLRSVRYRQYFTDGLGLGVVSDHAVDTGVDGGNAGFSYSTPGGLQAVVIGPDLWTKPEGGVWSLGEASPMNPPANWPDEYEGSVGFVLGRTEVIDGETCQVVTFLAPDLPNRAAAWYAWWVGVDTGFVRRDVMISRDHYMTGFYTDFDQPLGLVPPVTGNAGSPVAAPAAGSPTP